VLGKGVGDVPSKGNPVIEDDPEASMSSGAPAVTCLIVWKPSQAAALLLLKLNNAEALSHGNLDPGEAHRHTLCPGPGLSL
jgi:hypothetical protein